MLVLIVITLARSRKRSYPFWYYVNGSSDKDGNCNCCLVFCLLPAYFTPGNYYHMNVLFIIPDTFLLPFIRGDYCTGLVYNQNEGAGDCYTAWPGRYNCELRV